jgi:hypothetical protein
MVALSRGLVCVLLYSSLQAYANTALGSILFKYFELWLGASSSTATFVFRWV